MMVRAAMLVFCQIVANECFWVGYFHGENADRAWQGLALGCCRSDPAGLRPTSGGLRASGKWRNQGYSASQMGWRSSSFWHRASSY